MSETPNSPSVEPRGRTSASPSELRAVATRLVQRLHNEGYEAFFAGGCVRDALLGEQPKDFDIATNARPKQVQKLFKNSGMVGAHFGVVLVREPEADFEIATFRTDGIYLDGRRPKDVRFSTAEEDAERRDFTINGMFENPISGEIIDYVGGRADLKAKVIRAIGNPLDRFKEDHLRLLRAVRFAASLSFEVDTKTLAAIQESAPQILNISAERIRDELARILVHPNRVRGFDLLVGTSLMAEILPEIMELSGCEQPPQFHPEGDVFVHTRLVLSQVPDEASLPLVLSALLHDIGKPGTFSYDEEAQRIRFNGHAELGATMTEEILRRLKFSNEVIDATVVGVANHMNFMHVQEMRVATLKRMMARPTFDDELALHRADCLGGGGRLANYDFVVQRQEEFAAEPLIPPRLVNGRDLIELGWKAGPELGQILDAVQSEQLEGRVTTKAEAIAWVQANYATSS